MGQGRIISKNEDRVSPWVSLITKEVEFAPGRDTEIYHSFSQSDYISILARTKNGLIPLVGQYRPAVEEYTLELPAGLVDEGEAPIETCRRELMEETGLVAEEITPLGNFFTDTGRQENRTHGFLVNSSDPDPDFVPEEGIDVEYVSLDSLKNNILTNKFRLISHIGIVSMALWRSDFRF